MNQYLNLYEYLDIARKIAIKYGINPKNEEAVAYIGEHMMIADRDFDGRGNKDKFRIYYGKFGARKWKARYYKKDNLVSLDDIAFRYDKKFDFIETTSLTALQHMQFTEVKDIANKLLSGNHKKIFELYMMNHKIPDIAQRVKLSRQYIYVSIRKSITKIREYYAQN